MTETSLGTARRLRSLIAVGLLVAAGLTGCGASGSDDATSADDGIRALCSAYTNLPDSGSIRSSLRAWHEQWAELTPPDGMPETARTGMLLQSEVSTRTTPIPGDQEEIAALDDFHAYATKHCGSPPFSLEMTSEYPSEPDVE